MMTCQRKTRLKNKIQASRGRLMESQPFFAILLMYLKFVAVPGMKKMSTDGRCIYFSPEFVEKLYEYELDYILCHQIIHIIYGHIKRPFDREGDSYHFACEILTNLALYDCEFTEKKYPHLGEIHTRIPGEEESHDKMSPEEVFNRLPYNIGIFDERIRNKYIADSDIYWSGERVAEISGEVIVDIADEDRILRGATGQEGGLSDESKAMRQEEGNLTASDGNADGGDDLQQEWNGRVAAAVKFTQNTDSKKSGAGNIPDFVKRMIEKMKEPTLDWKKILNNFVQEQVCDYSFSPPDRRFSDTGFFLPDFNEKDFASKEILFMVDTSGSVTDEELATVYSEIKGAIEQFSGKLTGKLGFFDAEVTAPLPFESIGDLMGIIPYGGGGTDFCVIFDYIQRNLKTDLPACVVIFTDGDGPYPEESNTMGIPVLWIINNEEFTPHWGRVTRLLTY